MNLNFGSGESKLPGFINIDIELSQKPEVICDITRVFLPFNDTIADKIFFIHTIEHISKNNHFEIFKEFNRILKQKGRLFLAYPEFAKCAQNWLENKKGMREWWEKTIFGRQLWPSDSHVCAMDTNEVIELLSLAGFKIVKSGPECANEDYYTVVSAEKISRVHDYETVIAEEIFGIQ